MAAIPSFGHVKIQHVHTVNSQSGRDELQIVLQVISPQKGMYRPKKMNARVLSKGLSNCVDCIAVKC